MLLLPERSLSTLEKPGKPKLLDLFCGAGEGYRRAGFEVTGVDNRPQPHYKAGRFIQADALDYVAGEGWRYDAIHASPPCQKHTTMQNVNRARGFENPHLDLIPVTRFWLETLGLPYVIENVQGSSLKTQIIVCGHSLGLPRLARHRHFQSNVLLFVPRCSHRGSKEMMIGVYGKRPDGRRVNQRQYKRTRAASSIAEARTVMGIDWMVWDEIKEAVPPAYTEWIGRQLMTYVVARKRLAQDYTANMFEALPAAPQPDPAAALTSDYVTEQVYCIEAKDAL